MKEKTEERSWAEPYKIKMVELLSKNTKEERIKAIEEAGFNIIEQVDHIGISQTLLKCKKK